MNFAFSTLLIIFFITPGAIFRRSYYSSRFSINFLPSNFTNEIIWSLVPAIIIHAFAIICIESSTNYYFVFEYVGRLLIGSNELSLIDSVFINLHDNFKSIIIYNAIVFILPVILGHFSRYIVRQLKWDIIFSYLTFPNRWHYFFTAEYLEFSERGSSSRVSFVFVDVLVNIAGKAVIYSGIAEDYFLSRTTEGLDRIIIKYPSKKEFNCTIRKITNEDNVETNEDNVETSIYIPGDYLSIPYHKIENINFTYIEISDES